MKNRMKLSLIASVVSAFVTGCQVQQYASVTADYLITNGRVFVGDSSGEQALDVAICGQVICAVAPSGQLSVSAKHTVNADGKIVSPGFIDPHTHTLKELLSEDKNHNLNYLTQGVTTVVNGNDGGGPFKIAETGNKLEQNGIGTNVVLLAGHNSIRQEVMGRENRHATKAEITQMQSLLEDAMQQGAYGLSTGLYYVPGSYASTDEVVALAKVASQHKGIYDTHLRDESTFSVGFLSALQEAIDITSDAGIHLHLAHIKALGVDTWGQSEKAIEKVNQARKNGASISADQYPWLASGTKMHSAIMPKWAMADSKKAFHKRLNDPGLRNRLIDEISENIRRRGGPDALLVTAFKEPAMMGATLEKVSKEIGVASTDMVKAFRDPKLVGKTLKQLSEEMGLPPAEAAMQLVQLGSIRVASFNMSERDVKNFMTQEWVVTSSDGTNGHPRKYASFPKKFDTYVKEKGYLTVDEFISRSSGQTASILGMTDRGLVKEGLVADIVIWDPEHYQANANFSYWDRYSSGLDTVWVNGQLVIEDGSYNGKLAGKFLPKFKSN